MSSAKKRKRRRAAQKKKGGVMTGMRGGFKNLAANMSGQETAKKKNAWIGTVITVVLLAAAAALLYQRFG